MKKKPKILRRGKCVWRADFTYIYLSGRCGKHVLVGTADPAIGAALSRAVEYLRQNSEEFRDWALLKIEYLGTIKA
ncbi:MAG: hypothetical protein JWQ04_649 [Pedosphaera sp.]|nr:hypothetical protein [Pedosphaera sp.]